MYIAGNNLLLRTTYRLVVSDGAFFILTRLKLTIFEVLAVMRFILWFLRHDSVQTCIYQEFKILEIKQVYFYALRA